MAYYIDIIDTVDDSLTTIYELARKDGINLNYRGADALDKLNIVGSVLFFEVNVPRHNNNDAVFIDLFTGDETRYRAELRRDSDNLLVWQGFMLPDSYSEPYTGSTYFVGFEATDGLGRLKGKYLSDDFYKEEKSVIEIVSACLRLTGLRLPLIMAPGVDNTLEKNWHLVYIDTSLYIEKGKKEDAYKILEALVNDTVSCLYQHLAHWYFEGLNKHSLATYGAKFYDPYGNYVSEWQVEKAVKEGVNRFTGIPLVTMMAPYNEIAISYDAYSVGFPETIFQEKNEGWIADDSIDGEIMATDWFGRDGFHAKAKKPKYKVWLPMTLTFDAQKYISLNRKIFLKKGIKVKLTMKFETDPWADYYKDTAIAGGFRDNNLKYNILLNYDVLFSNFGTPSNKEEIKFGTDDKVELGFEFIAEEDGLLDVILYQPYGNIISAAMRGVFIDELEISEIAFSEDGYVSDMINSEYTMDKDMELTFTDNAAGLGSVFRLGRLDQHNATEYNVINVPISYGRMFEGVNYAIVSLQGANLIADNHETVYMNGVLLPPLEVIYNFNNGEEMVVITDSLYTTGDVFEVRQYKKIDYSLDRVHWERWTDSVYQVEKKRYTAAVIGVYRRLFDIPKPKIDGTIRGPILFGDLVSFNYITLQNYSIVNTRINFDSGYSDITMVKSGYAQGESGNLPPFVDCGPDIYIGEFETTAFLDATAFDPDGFIVTYLWEKLSGDAGDMIVTPDYEDTNIIGLTGDAYEYRLTVTDNGGASASCSTRVFRTYDYDIDLELRYYNEWVDDDPDNPVIDVLVDAVWDLTVGREIPEGAYITFNYDARVFKQQSAFDSVNDFASIVIYKNGVIIGNFGVTTQAAEDQTYTGVINFNKGDAVHVELRMRGYSNAAPDTNPTAIFTLVSGSMFNAPGNLLGLPEFVKVVKP